MGAEILVMFSQRSIDMLIPKKRGTGFLKTPLGHHHCPLADMQYEIGFDLWGFDGSLTIMTGWIEKKDYDNLIEVAVRPIAVHLGFPWRVVTTNEFWENHPILPKEKALD